MDMKLWLKAAVRSQEAIMERSFKKQTSEGSAVAGGSSVKC
jgi:hypothetical protein